MWGKWQPKWGGNKVKPLPVKDVRLGDIIWFEGNDQKECTRVVHAFSYNSRKDLVTLEYEGFLGGDIWGAHAVVMKQLPKK